MNIPQVITSNGTVNYVLDGKSFLFHKENPFHSKILDALHKSNTEILKKYSDVSNTINEWGCGRVFSRCGNIYIKTDSEEILLSDKIHERIITLIHDNIDCNYLIRFLFNLMENKSVESIKSMYDFLQHKNLPLTDDGCFLAYKAVSNNYYDKHSGKFLNTVGSILEIPIEQVDPNRNNECSYGLHVGAIDYVIDFGNLERNFKIPVEDSETKYFGDRVVIVKVNPRDAIAVPIDCNFQKLRVCRYEVISELLDGESFYTDSVVHVSKYLTNEE